MKSINNSIRRAKQINFAHMYSKHLIQIIQEKSVSKRWDAREELLIEWILDFVEFLIAISVTSHGDIREKLNMAFNMYGTLTSIWHLSMYIYRRLDIDKNGRVDSKEMEQIVTVCFDENSIKRNARMCDYSRLFTIYSVKRIAKVKILLQNVWKKSWWD